MIMHNNMNNSTQKSINKGLKEGEIFLIVLLFAGLYKMAYLAAKDSKLAI